MKLYNLTLEAQNDLDQIGNYIASRGSPERAKAVLLKIGEELRKIGASPGMGHFREEVDDNRLRFWSIYSYLIAYRWDVRPIEVIAIVHGARDLARFFEDRLE